MRIANVTAFLFSTCFLANTALAQPDLDPKAAADGSKAGGGLIESLLAGKTFTGLTPADIMLLVMLVGFAAYVILRTRSERNDHQDHHTSSSESQEDDDLPGPGRDSEAYRRAQHTWDFLSSKPGEQQQSPPEPPRGERPHQQESASLGPDLDQDLARDLPEPPSSEQAGFDTDDLLQGAKVVYARMHESIAESDWDDVAQFATPELVEQLKQRVGAKRRPPQVLFVEAGIENAETRDGHSTADVVFASLMQFDADQSPQQVRETWRFEKGGAGGDSWRISSMKRRQ